MQLRIVCPESCAFEGDCAFVALPGTTGEFGVAPLHASEVCTLKPGYVRVSEQAMGTVDRVFAVGEGYAQVADDVIIVLVERACDLASLDRSETERQLGVFEDQLSKCGPEDAHRAYIYTEVAWCKLLLGYKDRA